MCLHILNAGGWSHGAIYYGNISQYIMVTSFHFYTLQKIFMVKSKHFIRLIIKLWLLIGCTPDNKVLLQSSEIFLPPINKYNYGVKRVNVLFTSHRYIYLTV